MSSSPPLPASTLWVLLAVAARKQPPVWAHAVIALQLDERLASEQPVAGRGDWIVCPSENAGVAAQTQDRIRALVTTETFGERFVTKVLGRRLELSP